MMSKKTLIKIDSQSDCRLWLLHQIPCIYRYEFTKTMKITRAQGQLHKTFAYRSYLLRTAEPDVCEDYRDNWMTRRNRRWAMAEFDKWFAIAKADKAAQKARYQPDPESNFDIEVFMQFFGWEMVEIQALHTFLPILNYWVRQIAKLPNLLVEFTQTLAKNLSDWFIPSINPPNAWWD